MLNFHDFVHTNPGFKQFEVDELLFTAYDCIIEESPLHYWTHKNYFAYTTRGSLQWKTLQNTYTIKAGDCVFVKSGAHRAYKVLDGDFCALLIFIPDEFIQKVIQDRSPEIKSLQPLAGSDCIIPIDVNESLSSYFLSILNYFVKKDPPGKSLLKVRFEELILTVLTESSNPLLTNHFKDLCSDQKKSLQSIMEGNFTANLTLNEFARLSGRSLASFKRDFMTVYNTSPGRWLKSKRLEYGRFLLETTDQKVNEITMNAGFENTSHFIRAFKERFKHPPLHYRKHLVR